MKTEDLEALENRIEELERKARRPYLLLFVVWGLVIACFMQDSINASLKRQIDSLRQAEVTHAE